LSGLLETDLARNACARRGLAYIAQETAAFAATEAADAAFFAGNSYEQAITSKPS
jgi:hypothetical protein